MVSSDERFGKILQLLGFYYHGFVHLSTREKDPSKDGYKTECDSFLQLREKLSIFMTVLTILDGPVEFVCPFTIPNGDVLELSIQL